jgi:hypothetical protein
LGSWHEFGYSYVYSHAYDVYGLTVFGVGIGNWIYWTPITQLQVWIRPSLFCTLHKSLLDTLGINISLLVTASSGRRFHSCGYSNCPHAATLDWQTHSRLILFITSWPGLHRKYRCSVPCCFCLCSSQCLLLRKHNSSLVVYRPLLSTGCCMFACLDVVAKQQIVCMSC